MTFNQRSFRTRDLWQSYILVVQDSDAAIELPFEPRFRQYDELDSMDNIGGYSDGMANGTEPFTRFMAPVLFQEYGAVCLIFVRHEETLAVGMLAYDQISGYARSIYPSDQGFAGRMCVYTAGNGHPIPIEQDTLIDMLNATVLMKRAHSYDGGVVDPNAPKKQPKDRLLRDALAPGDGFDGLPQGRPRDPLAVEGHEVLPDGNMVGVMDEGALNNDDPHRVMGGLEENVVAVGHPFVIGVRPWEQAVIGQIPIVFHVDDLVDDPVADGDDDEPIDEMGFDGIGDDGEDDVLGGAA